MKEGGERITLDSAAVVKLLEAVCTARCVDIIDYDAEQLIYIFLSQFPGVHYVFYIAVEILSTFSCP